MLSISVRLPRRRATGLALLALAKAIRDSRRGYCGTYGK